MKPCCAAIMLRTAGIAIKKNNSEALCLFVDVC